MLFVDPAGSSSTQPVSLRRPSPKALVVDPACHINVFEKKGSGEKDIWRCERRKECKARVHVSEGIVVQEVNDHSHAPDPTRKEARGLKRKIRRSAIETADKPHAIVGRVLETASDTVLATLPHRDHLRRCVRRAKRNFGQYPPEPEDLNFDVPAQFSTWSPGGVEETLIKYDSRKGEDRILLVSCDEL